jgi:hypothetical protein
MVAPEGPQVPFCFVLFICLVLVTICSWGLELCNL